MSVSSSTISTYVLSYTYFGYHLSPNEHVLFSLHPSPHSLFSIWKTPSHVSGFSFNEVFLPLERLLWLDQKQSIILYSVLLSALYMPTESRTCIVLVLTSPPRAFLPFGVLHDFYLTSVCPCTVHIVEGVRLRLKPIILITGCNEWFRYGRIPKSRQRCKRQAVLLDLKQVVPLLFLGKLEEKEKEEKNFLFLKQYNNFSASSHTVLTCPSLHCVSTPTSQLSKSLTPLSGSHFKSAWPLNINLA